MGDVVNEAARLASYGRKTWQDKALMLSSDFRFNLNEHNQGLVEWNSLRGCYHGSVIDTAMEAWYAANCT
jgi:hypothetical protein